MNRRTLLSIISLALAIFVFMPAQARAQGSSDGQGAPAGNAATPATPAQPDAATTANSNAVTTATPAKKVWTNEDMKDVHRNDAISTFSNAGNKPANGKPAPPAQANKNAKNYQAQITRLQEKLPPLDEQITQLQAALNGDTVNSTRHIGAKIDDWHDELVRLQKQREDIVAKISALQDEARRSGVPPNQIPQ